MPNFDERKIPTLDDVIEDDDNEKIDFDLSIDNDEMLDNESYSVETNLNLFTSETNDLTTEDSNINVEETAISDAIIEDTINSEADPQLGTIDNINNGDEGNNKAEIYTPAEVAEDEIDGIESALINYNIADEENATPSTIDPPVIEEPCHTTDKQTVEAEPQTTLSIQSVTDDIVKQLMPRLEQQLRVLLEQALKEKLPKEIIHYQSTETSSENNN